MSRITNTEKKQIVERLYDRYGAVALIKKGSIDEVASEFGHQRASTSWIKEAREAHGLYNVAKLIQMYNIDGSSAKAPVAVAETVAPVTNSVVNFPSPEVAPPVAEAGIRVVQKVEQSLVPDKDELFVPGDHYPIIEKIMASKYFYPTYVSGQSGTGKSKSVVQSAAKLGRELIRINVSSGTDGAELIGTWTLIDGTTRFSYGPVVEAMKRGAVLLIDEIDALSPTNAFELYQTLESGSVHIKDTGEFVKAAPGFNVFATANTKGQGNDDGRYIGTAVQNEAMLERFPVTVEFGYPSKAQERKIITKLFKNFGLDSEEDKVFAKNLLDWVSIIRKSFEEGACEAVIATRRVAHLVKAYAIFQDKGQAINLCVARFDDETKSSFLDLFEKIAGEEIVVGENGEVVDPADDDSNDSDAAGPGQWNADYSNNSN